MRSWRNWQTRKTKDLVVNPMQVQFLSTAPPDSLNFFVIKRMFGLFLFYFSSEVTIWQIISKSAARGCTI